MYKQVGVCVLRIYNQCLYHIFDDAQFVLVEQMVIKVIGRFTVRNILGFSVAAGINVNWHLSLGRCDISLTADCIIFIFFCFWRCHKQSYQLTSMIVAKVITLLNTVLGTLQGEVIEDAVLFYCVSIGTCIVARNWMSTSLEL